MTTRGSVVQLKGKYNVWVESRRKWVDIDDERPAICLLPEGFAEVLGAQVVVHGTTHGDRLSPHHDSSQALTDGDGDDIAVAAENLKAFEFGQRWYGADARETAWKAYQIDLTTDNKLVASRGTIAGQWTRDAQSHFSALLTDSTQAHRQLRRSRRHRHADVRNLKGGDVLVLNDQHLLVLSNEVIHDRFPFAIALACPLIADSEIPPHSDGAVFFRERRVAWELAQRVELEALPFNVASEAERAPPLLLAKARSAVLRFWAGEAPDGIAPQGFLMFLARCAQERQRLRLSVQLAPVFINNTQRYAYVERRIVPYGGNFWDAGATESIPGRELIEIETDSSLVLFTLVRVGSEVSVVIECSEVPDVHILYAWGMDGDQEIASVGQSTIRAAHGIARLSLGKAQSGVPFCRSFGVGTTHGPAVVDVDVTWSTGSEP